MLGCWVAGLLGCWVAGLLGCWVAGLLGCWVAGLLGCWVAGLSSRIDDLPFKSLCSRCIHVTWHRFLVGRNALLLHMPSCNLQVLEDWVAILRSKQHPIGSKYVQDPLLNPLDAEFLATSSYTTAYGSDATQYVSQWTFFFAPHTLLNEPQRAVKKCEAV